MDSWLYNPELEMMRWRLQVLAMGLQHQPHQQYQQYVPFHLQSGDNFGVNIKQEPEPEREQTQNSNLLFRPAFQTRPGSVSPRLDSRGSSSPSSYRSSPSPPSTSWAEQSEPLDLTVSLHTKPGPATASTDSDPAKSTGACGVCSVCSKEYSSPAALSMHMRTHTAGCKCPFCGKSFSRPWLLQGHIRTHTGEKPFSCHLCNKAFADKSNLRAHVQTHSSDKPFSCAKCGKCFALKSYLSKHEESSCLKTDRERSHSGSQSQAKRSKSESSEAGSGLTGLTGLVPRALPACSASSELSLTRLLSSPSLLPQSQISQATLQALKMAVFANKS